MIDPVTLRKQIQANLTASEVNDLIFQLQINDEYTHGLKSDKVRELVNHCQRQGRLDELAAVYQQTLVAKTHPATNFIMMAPELPDDFVPRPTEYNQLLEYLLNNNSDKPVAITAALRGAGGYGKTTLAAALCHDERIQAAFPDGILWITLGERPTNLVGLVEDLIYKLTGTRPGFVDLNAAAGELSQAMGERRCLLVIDDVWNEAHLKPFLREGTQCTRLVTTRNRDTLPLIAQTVDVDAMRQSEAVLLLGSQLPDAEKASLTWELMKLGERLGEWPVLLKLINRVLLRRFQQQPLAQAIAYVNQSLSKRGLAAFDRRNAAERHQAVAQTIGVSLEMLTDDEQQRLAELAIFPEDIEIPLAMVQRLWATTGGLNEFETEELCQQLYDFSLLLSYQLAAPQVVRLHDILRAYFLDQLGSSVAKINLALLGHATTFDAIWDLWSESYMRRYLAYHLFAAEKKGLLRQQLLDYDWMWQKLQTGGVAELLADYDYMLDDDVIEIIQRTLYMAAPFLSRYKGQLLSQLQGRLLAHPSSDIQSLLAQGHRSRFQADSLLSLLASLPSPESPLLLTLTGHSDLVSAVAITPDGQRAISASYDNTLKLWNLRTGAEERTFAGHSDSVTAVAITPDGQYAVFALYNTLKLWNLRTGGEERTLSGHSDLVSAVAITPDGQRAISASHDHTLKLWNLSTGKEEHTLTGHSNWVHDVAITPNGQYAVSASSDETLRLWNLRTGEEEHVLTGHFDEVFAVAITPDGQRAVSAAYDLKLWNLNTGQDECTLTGHFHEVPGIAITPDGQRVVSASYDTTLRLWNLSTGEEERIFSSHSAGVGTVAITPDGRHAVSGSIDSTLKLWNLSIGEEEHPLTGHWDKVNALAIAPDGQRAVSASYDNTLKLWNLSTGEEERTFSGHSNWIDDVAITPDGQRAVSASYDNTLKLWNLSTGEEERTLLGHSDIVNAVAITPDGQRIISASREQTLKLWNLSTGEEECTFSSHSYVNALAITPNGQRFVFASYNLVKLWNLSTGEEEHTFAGHLDGINDLAITPDGQRVVSASDDNTLKLWNLSTGEEERTFWGHSGRIWAMDVTPDSQYAVSVSGDQTLKLWNLATGGVETELGLGTRLTSVAIAFDGQTKTIVVGDETGIVHFLRWHQPFLT